MAGNSLFNDALLSAASVTYFDHGGCGASDRDVNDISEKAFVRATEAVVAACMRNERFTVIAVGGACPGAALYTTAHPESVKRWSASIRCTRRRSRHWYAPTGLWAAG